MMQAASSALALLLISVVLYWNQTFDRRLELSLTQLHTTLALSSQLHASHEALALAFWEGYFRNTKEHTSAFKEESRELTESVDRFAAFPFPQEDRILVDDLRRFEESFQSLTAHLMAGPRNAKDDDRQLWEVNHVTGEIERGLHRLEDTEIKRFQALTAERKLFATGMAALLIGFAVIAVGISIWFRHAQKDHLWRHLEQLRHMVAEVRRGNLNVCGEIPESLELGSLTRAFLQMALELREMRDSLETKVRERTASLELVQKELLQAAKLASLGELVSGVAHEINNPLTSILGFSEVAIGRVESHPEIQGPLRAIREEALRLRSLVANLSAFARRAPQRRSRIDLRRVLTRFTELRDYQLRSNNISLHVAFPADPVWILGDPDQLLQVVMNLALNSEQAIKECRERGDIWLACGVEGATAWFSVKDDGPGIDPPVIDNIFNPFFTTKTAGKGTGLGLSVSHGIIQQHGGKIDVESERGKGSTFRATLPLAPVDAPSKPAQAHTEAPAPVPLEKKGGAPNGRHLLVIDDEADILEMITEALEPLGCRVATLQDSELAAAALARADIDAVLCDLKMPGRNGYEVYNMIRKQFPDLADRFILMTGNLADADRYGADLDAIVVLPKPFTLARLRELVQEVLRKHAPVRTGPAV